MQARLGKKGDMGDQLGTVLFATPTPQIGQISHALSANETLLPFNDRDSSRLGLQQEEGDVWQGGQDSAY